MKNSIILFFCCITSLVVGKEIMIIAHRGASGYEPENTLRAFERAIFMGAPMIELDVHLSQSNDLVVIHDFHTKDGKVVANLTTQELKQYDLGKGERIPLLSEVLNLIGERVIVNIELKAIGTAQPVAQLLKNSDPSKFIVSSFNHNLVKEFHSYAPEVPIGVIFEGNPIKPSQIALDADAQTIVGHYKWITSDFIKDAHAHGIQVFTYTVNEKPIAEKLQAMDIDGIITNYPDIMSKD